ncbi:hypothetical protein SAMN06265348_11924 [Pedobacter westerhofensis]|uniref:Uncharacterized protein n=1 Tax=Pedobacter westerhofensis TaxID=425512 RepID=A0A521FSF7_9SPHI|nr:hypothetical protein SAMN06265348_11924 [Pedobacter westerhofensis]
MWPIATLIKYEKDGLPYKAIVIKLTNEILREFYENKNLKVTSTFKSGKIIQLPKSPL